MLLSQLHLRWILEPSDGLHGPQVVHPLAAITPSPALLLSPALWHFLNCEAQGLCIYRSPCPTLHRANYSFFGSWLKCHFQEKTVCPYVLKLYVPFTCFLIPSTFSAPEENSISYNICAIYLRSISLTDNTLLEGGIVVVLSPLNPRCPGQCLAQGKFSVTIKVGVFWKF